MSKAESRSEGVRCGRGLGVDEDGLRRTIPPHCGRRNALDGLTEGSFWSPSSRMWRGLCLEEGMKRTKCITGSFEALEAVRVSVWVNVLTVVHFHAQSVHSAEFTKTVRSSWVRPCRSWPSCCTWRGSNARGACN